MRSLVLIIALFLLPLAAADGPTASVGTLSHKNGCSSSGTSTAAYDDWSYRYSNSQKHDCAAEADTVAVAAGDDAGPLASVRAYDGNASSYSDTRNESGYHYGFGNYSSNGGESSGESTWSFERMRGAEASALGASAGEASGCRYSFADARDGTYHRDSFPSPDGTAWSYASNRQNERSTSASTCGDEAYAGIAGHGASAGDVSGCQRSQSHFSDSGSSWSNSNSNYRNWESDANQTTCRNGVRAGAEGLHAFAGNENACNNFSDSRTEQSSSNSSWSSQSDSYQRSDCFQGYAVEGPAGMRLSAGNQTYSYSSCHSTNWNGQTCRGESSTDQAITWSWDESPVQQLSFLGLNTPVYVPLLA